MRMMPRATPSTMLGGWECAGIACLVGMGVQRMVQKNGNVKSEAKYLACEEPPIYALDSTLSCFSVTLLASTVG